MANLSIGDALGSGFGLLGRRPVSVLVWGLVALIVGMVVPLALFGSGLMTDYVTLFRNLGPGFGAVPPARMMQLMAPLQAKLMVIDPIVLVLSLLLRAVITAAVFRAVLQPRKRGLAYLQLGGRELWLALLNFVAQLLAAFLVVALAVIGVIIGFALNAVFESQHVEWAARVAAFVAIGIVVFAIFIGICVRFSMAWPMTFADGQFRLFESWGLTRRHGWKLFGLALVVSIISILVVMVVEAVAAVIVILAAGRAHWDPLAAMDLMQHPQALLTPGFMAGLGVGALAGSYLIGALFAITAGPWAAAYGQLTASRPAGPREGSEYVPASPLMPPEPDLAPPPAPPPVLEPSHEPAPEPTPEPDADHHAGQDHGHADPHDGGEDDGHGEDHDHGDGHGHH
jgi:hypothetical protein